MSKLTNIRVFGVGNGLICSTCSKNQNTTQQSLLALDDVPITGSVVEGGVIYRGMCVNCIVEAIKTGLLTLFLGDVTLVEDGEPGFLATGEDGAISLNNGLGDAVEVRW